MAVYWSGGAPGIFNPAAFIEVAGSNPPLRPATGTVVAVRNADTGVAITTGLYDAAGAATTQVVTLASGYLCFGVEDVPIVEVSADGWATVARLTMQTTIEELLDFNPATIPTNSVVEAQLAVNNAPVNGYVLSWDSTLNLMKWVPATPATHTHAAADVTSGTLAIDRLPAGMVLAAIKPPGGNWPSARPTARGDLVVAWIGVAPGPAIVSSGTGGMRDGLDLWFIPAT